MATYTWTKAQWDSLSGTLVAGDLVNFVPGTYTTGIQMPVSGSVGNPIVVDGKFSILNGGGATAIGINTNAKSYVTFKNFEVKGFRNGGVTAGATEGAVYAAGDFGTGVTFQNLWVHNNGVYVFQQSNPFAGISISGTVNGTIINCTVDHEDLNGGAAYRMKYTSGAKLQKSITDSISEDGVNIYESTNALVEDCWIQNMRHNPLPPDPDTPHPDGINLSNVDTCVIRRNVISGWTQMIYGNGGNPSTQNLKNIYIYSNFIYGVPGTTDPAYGDWNQAAVGAPGIFLYGSFPDVYSKNVQIFWNTMGYTGNASYVTQGANAGANAGPVKIYNNAFYNTRGSLNNGIWSYDNPNGNVVINNNAYFTCTGSDTNQVTTNPLFTNYNAQLGTGLDVSIPSNSPLKNAGNATLGTDVTITQAKDLAGNTRATSVATTIGCMEVGSTMPSKSSVGFQASATVSASNSTVQASPTTVANGTNSTITVTVKDASNVPISGSSIVLSSTGSNNTWGSATGTTNGSGVYSTTLSSTTAETKTITAVADGTTIVQTASVTVQAATGGGSIIDPRTGMILMVYPGVGVDATAAIQAAINGAPVGETVWIPPATGDWTISTPSVGGSNVTTYGISLKTGVNLKIDGTLTAKPGSFLGNYDTMVGGYQVSNIIVSGIGTIKMQKAEYTAGEWRHCFQLRECNNVRVTGIVCRDAGGDGFDVGRANDDIAPKPASTNITFENVLAINNKRNGMSLRNCTDVTIIGSEFSSNIGTNPQSGVDVEPDDLSDSIQRINFVNCTANNNFHYGFIVSLRFQTNASNPISVGFRNCIVRGGVDSYLVQDAQSSSVPGTIIFENCYAYDSSDAAIWFGNWDLSSKISVQFNNTYLKHVATGAGTFPIGFDVKDTVPTQQGGSLSVGGVIDDQQHGTTMASLTETGSTRVRSAAIGRIFLLQHHEQVVAELAMGRTDAYTLSSLKPLFSGSAISQVTLSLPAPTNRNIGGGYAGAAILEIIS